MQNKWAQGMQLETYITQRKILYEVAIMLNYDALKTPC